MRRPDTLSRRRPPAGEGRTAAPRPGLSALPAPPAGAWEPPGDLLDALAELLAEGGEPSDGRPQGRGESPLRVR